MPYTMTMKKFSWNPEKNELLARERGITFDEIVQRIDAGAKVIETDHPNPKKYPNQKILIVDVDGYAYLVPYVVDEDGYFLKTIIPSRKATRQYLGGQNE
ncbi:MAG: BrnT family toxin [Thermodesulfobacteriota bacterium]|nr:BrnT family toxin [Thermodesulfobacteriota bacterium]